MLRTSPETVPPVVLRGAVCHPLTSSTFGERCLLGLNAAALYTLLSYLVVPATGLSDAPGLVKPPRREQVYPSLSKD